MKRNFHYLAGILALFILTGCETGKYAANQTFGDSREFGPGSRDTQPVPDNSLAVADDWVRRNMW
jgi:hypothetical protein